MTAPTTIAAYIASFPPYVRRVLQKMRRTIKAAAPRAGEAISYGIPAFTLNGRSFVSFAGWKKHVSIYPIPRGDADFRKQIKAYKSGPGTLRFPLDKPVSYGLITMAVKFLVIERAAWPNAKVKAKVR